MMHGVTEQNNTRPGEPHPIAATVDRRDCTPWCATGMPRAFRYAFSRMNSSTSLTPDGGGTTLPCARHHGHHHHGGNRTAVVVTVPRHLRNSHTRCAVVTNSSFAVDGSAPTYLAGRHGRATGSRQQVLVVRRVQQAEVGSQLPPRNRYTDTHKQTDRGS